MTPSATDVEKTGDKAATQVHDGDSSDHAAYSSQEGRVEDPESWVKRLWQGLRLELTETRGVERVPQEERQQVSLRLQSNSAPS